MNLLFLWLIMLLAFYLVYALASRSAARQAAAAASQPPPVIPTELLAASEAKLAPWMAITSHKVVGEILEFDGRLRGKADEVFQKIRGAFAGEPVSPMLLEGERDEARVLLVPGDVVKSEERERPKWALHWLLLLATLATTTWAGAMQAGVNLLQEPGRFGVGLPYSLALLLILGSHELGHYFAAKAHRIRVTPPYFIPVPFALGTFGAFIRIKSLPPTRRALFDVAVAGPLVGLVFAIPALIVGLQFSQVVSVNGNAPGPLDQVGINPNSSLLLSWLARLSLGPSIIGENHLLLHPLAFAGWLGLIITALNLLPIGQLDGGHISHALFGSRKSYVVSTVVLVVLFLVAVFVWPGLLFWAFVVYFIAGTRDSPAANDLSPVDSRRKALGYFTFLLLLLIITPVPHSFHRVVAPHSPYI